jgi:hypothetical protein
MQKSFLKIQSFRRYLNINIFESDLKNFKKRDYYSLIQNNNYKSFNKKLLISKSKTYGNLNKFG